ncbi:DUF2254 domain-containing protein [Pyxidicoccus fallax]|uniref:DUF2254 domain-containing protein n=1 Tax=Pyxidicoccus fallax TaxID=394095 RepID=A0A848LZM2_9BACT|nr:DUF2254 domain-containing protein [Pyxidicoccus fallax]NMO23535.1 DUF2254 domain-containing protein [Pyxidicoccus fallax]NPC86906.1 DUF2254 domain-containing protein [Pyxidicoccus fallax]
MANRLGESLLIIPGIMVLGAIGLEFTASWLDRTLEPGTLPGFLRLSSEATVQLLSTIAGATITTVGVVFSLLVVSMQLASGQFSPRVLHTFFHERLGKVVVGLLAAVFTYCVLALRALPEDLASSPSAVPHLTVDLAVLLTLVSVGVLVLYLHRIARRQYVGSIIAAITEETLEQVEELCWTGKVLAPEEPPDVSRLGAPLVVSARVSGWVQQVSTTGLLAAVPPGSVLRLETRVGAFLAKGIPLATIWPNPGQEATVSRALHAAVVVGSSRTTRQDVDFGLRQLSDIALRSLSPAVNDPTTAIEVVVRMATILRQLLLIELPPQVRVADNGSVLLRPWDLDHAEYVRHAFEQLRIYAAPHPQVAIALVRSMRMLWEAVDGADRVEAQRELERQLDLALQGCERAGLLPADMEAVREAATHVQDPLRQLGLSEHGPVVH